MRGYGQFFLKTLNIDTLTDLLFQLRFIHCATVSPFIFYCLSFSLTGEWKGEKLLKTEEASMNCTAYIYYVMIIAKCTCTWLHHPLKLLPSMFRCVPIQVSLMLRLICMFLGCDLPIQLLLKSLPSEYDDRLVDCFIMYRFTSQTTKCICNILCLNKQTYTFFYL